REAHLGQRSHIRAQKAGHMSASDPIKSSSAKTLQAGGRPHMSTVLLRRSRTGKRRNPPLAGRHHLNIKAI
ncbi:hypothetical protein O7A70_16280, partial [Mesorhizobium sp. Cs1299R1N1]|uniref:hypothetical protein n=1 Tax=Mesorhizobium sp. Cs1299R1N1 TaxID=3015172 RepID=UPI00301DB850